MAPTGVGEGVGVLDVVVGPGGLGVVVVGVVVVGELLEIELGPE